MMLTLVGRSADPGVIAVGWRQGDTLHGVHGRDEHRHGMASQRRLSRRETSWRRPRLTLNRARTGSEAQADAGGRRLHTRVRPCFGCCFSAATRAGAIYTTAMGLPGDPVAPLSRSGLKI
jgi:hypothetical protein